MTCGWQTGEVPIPTEVELPASIRGVAEKVLERLALSAELADRIGLACLTPGEVGDTATRPYIRACATLGGLSFRLLALHRAMVLKAGEDAKANMVRAEQLRAPIEEEVALALNQRSDLAAPDAMTVVGQLLGAAVAAGAYGELIKLIADVRAEHRSSPPVYKTVLQEWAVARGLADPRYEVVGESGPAHDKTWEVRAHVGRFVSRPATGATKRLAEGAAAQALLAAHAPDRLRVRPSPRVSGDPTSLRVLTVHRREVEALTAQLRLPGSWSPLVSAALVQRAHGNLSPAHHAAAGGLAQLGAAALNAYALARILAEPNGVPEDATLVVNHAIGDEIMAAAFADAGLERGFVLHDSTPARAIPRLQTDCVQALAALSLLAHRTLAAFPRMLAPVGQHIAESLARARHLGRHELLDAKTALQEITVAGGARVEYHARERTGPDHEAEFRVEVGVRTISDGFAAVSGTGPSKREAEQAGARHILRALELDAASPSDARDVARLVVGQLSPGSLGARRLDRLPLAPVDHTRTRDWRRLDEWLDRLSEVLGESASFTWADALRPLSPVGSALDSAIFTDLVQISDSVAALEVGEQVTPRLLGLLSRTATTSRLRERPRTSRRLEEVAQELQLLHRRRHTLTFDGSWTGAIIERAGTVAALVDETLARGDDQTEWTIEATARDGRAEISIACALPVPQPTFSILDPLAEDMPILSMQAHERGLRADWLLDARPALARLYHADSPSGPDDGIASSLHDLKNALAAFVALSRRVTTTETQQHATAYEASKLLDEARRLCHSMLTTSQAMAPRLAPIDLAELIDQYVIELMHRRPREVAVAVGPMPSCVLPTSASLLTSALENLTKNAVEAMGGRGKLEFSLSADGEMARIEIHDTGGGLSDDQLELINLGRPLPSGKAGGSGLGLLSRRDGLQWPHRDGLKWPRLALVDLLV